ncbi:cytochrome P450 [Leucogyrophana mollusca]|uniref:Cytochrome P450 n=1 Tax=Leucogyrophana mollusca TaxID=85980 RepID=A0ACB8B495_9AGAM|nr:cytochrome P450 [Leucogyrophana mollusca]
MTLLPAIIEHWTRPPTLALVFTLYITYKVLHHIILWPYFLSPLRHLPGPPLGNPFLGQFPTILEEEAGVPQRRWLQEYGPIVRAVGPIGMERLIIISPEPLRKILISDWLDFPLPGLLRHMLGLTTGYSLMTVTGNEHKMMRKAMNPAFSIPNLMAQTDMYYDIIDGFVDVLTSAIEAEDVSGGGKVCLMYDLLRKITLDIICATAFGYKCNATKDPSDPLAKAYGELLDLQSGPNIAKFSLVLAIPGMAAFLRSEHAYRLRHWFHVNSVLGKIVAISAARNQNHDLNLYAIAPIGITVDAMYRIKAIARRILAERIAELETADSTPAPKRRDIMSLLLQARFAEKGEGYQISDADMVEHVLTFLGAGHETTASTLSWTLWLLANNKATQNTLRKEVTALVADNPRPDYRSLKDSPFLDAVIMESLRLFSPVPMTLRKAAKNTELDGTFIPKGTLIYIPIRVFNTWKEHWGDNAEEFRPERWHSLPGTYNPAFSLLSFSAGPHGCIGRTMAMMEMKAVLAILIAKFEFDLAYPGQVAKPRAGVTMKPSDCLPLRVTKVIK